MVLDFIFNRPINQVGLLIDLYIHRFIFNLVYMSMVCCVINRTSTLRKRTYLCLHLFLFLYFLKYKTVKTCSVNGCNSKAGQGIKFHGYLFL